MVDFGGSIVITVRSSVPHTVSPVSVSPNIKCGLFLSLINHIILRFFFQFYTSLGMMPREAEERAEWPRSGAFCKYCKVTYSADEGENISIRLPELPEQCSILLGTQLNVIKD